MKTVERAQNNYTDVYTKTGDNEWNTPSDMYDYLHSEFDFDNDPCAIGACNGLTNAWGKKNFVNPPYDDIARWLRKGIEEKHKGNLSVFLIPVRTCTHYFHQEIMTEADTIRFIRGRLRFTNSDDGKNGICPFPSMIVIYKPSIKTSNKEP